jgi:hypothetical protein
MRVLWQQTSHLLLKYTKSGYGTVLTAACARQGCSASGLVWFWVFDSAVFLTRVIVFAVYHDFGAVISRLRI